MSQMWWYRQLILRADYMHMCGRLFNDWLINMYCRMEDERFQNIRHQQKQKLAKRSDLCSHARIHFRARRRVENTHRRELPPSPLSLVPAPVASLTPARITGTASCAKPVMQAA